MLRPLNSMLPGFPFPGVLGALRQAQNVGLFQKIKLGHFTGNTGERISLLSVLVLTATATPNR